MTFCIHFDKNSEKFVLNGYYVMQGSYTAWNAAVIVVAEANRTLGESSPLDHVPC